MVFVGMVVAFTGPADLIPDGWMLCDGRPLARQGTYAPLFRVIGTLHGVGDNVSTFNIPDFRGYFLRGVSGNSDVDPDIESRIPMAGHKKNEVGSRQDCATAAPKTAFVTTKEGTHHHQDPTYNGQNGQYELAKEYRGPCGYDFGDQAAPTTDDGAHTHEVKAGGDQETRPKNKYVHWIIRVIP